MKPLLCLFLAFVTPLLAAEKPRIIFDTDITGDVDDVLALAMCHTLADRGACEFLGVTISKDNPLTGPFVDAVNSFYGRPELPIGVTRAAGVEKRESRYAGLALEKAADGTLRYPHDITSNDTLPEAVALLRRLLAAQPDHSVSLVSVGIAVNLRGLLHSQADAHSPLAGPALIQKKVKLLSIMAGAFQTVGDRNRHLEANVVNDIASMQAVAKEWPESVPVLWSGFEIGEALPFPRRVIQQDLDYTPHHIVKESYLLHSGPEHDRPCWDQSSVLYAVFPERGYFSLSRPGKVLVAEDGATTFQPPFRGTNLGKRDRFLKLENPAQTATALEAIIQLVTQPPAANHQVSSKSSADAAH